MPYVLPGRFQAGDGDFDGVRRQRQRNGLFLTWPERDAAEAGERTFHVSLHDFVACPVASVLNLYRESAGLQPQVPVDE